LPASHPALMISVGSEGEGSMSHHLRLLRADCHHPTRLPALAAVVAMLLAIGLAPAAAAECDARSYSNSVPPGVTPPRVYSGFGKTLDGSAGQHGPIIVRATISKSGEATDIEILCSETEGDFLPGARSELARRGFDPALDPSGHPIDFPRFIMRLDTSVAACTDKKYPEAPQPPGIVLPTPVKRVSMRYPRRAFETETFGRVVVSFSLTEEGKVKSTRVLCAAPAGFGFEDSTIEAVEKWRYAPATLNGKAVDIDGLIIEINFDQGLPVEAARTVVSFTITKTGETADAKITYSRPAGKYDQAVLDAVRRWRFDPVLKDGQPIDCRGRLAALAFAAVVGDAAIPVSSSPPNDLIRGLEKQTCK
jgi:TonB family protein